MISIKCEKIHPDAKMPVYAHQDDAGADISSSIGYTLAQGEIKAIPTGIRIELPVGYEVQVRPRSSIALYYGVTVLNTPGTIDSGYRGEVKVILINLGKKPYEIKKGDRIAQLVLKKVYEGDYEETERVSDTARGENGFGSTGK